VEGQRSEVLHLLQVGVAGDAQAEDHLEEVLAAGLRFGCAFGEGESALQLPVLILNLSDIFLLAIPGVLRAHAVSLLLARLLRLVVEDERRQL
jgi:hypothetical protein